MQTTGLKKGSAKVWYESYRMTQYRVVVYHFSDKTGHVVAQIPRLCRPLAGALTRTLEQVSPEAEIFQTSRVKFPDADSPNVIVPLDPIKLT